MDLGLFYFHVTVLEHISASYQFVTLSTLKKPRMELVGCSVFYQANFHMMHVIWGYSFKSNS